MLIIKHDTNHNDIHHLRLNLNQSSFPFHFTINNLTKITQSTNYLLSLLIFGYPRRLLWEGDLFRHALTANSKNSIEFTVQDVCK